MIISCSIIFTKNIFFILSKKKIHLYINIYLQCIYYYIANSILNIYVNMKFENNNEKEITFLLDLLNQIILKNLLLFILFNLKKERKMKREMKRKAINFTQGIQLKIISSRNKNGSNGTKYKRREDLIIYNIKEIKIDNNKIKEILRKKKEY